MKKIKLALPLLAGLSCVPAQAVLTPLLNADLNSLSLFAHAAVTTGATSKVFGSFEAGAGATIDDSSTIRNNVFAGADATMGANSKVGGNFWAGSAGTIGAKSSVGGSFQSMAAATVGANATLGGNLSAGAAVNLGAGSQVGGNMMAGAAATLGVGAVVSGTSSPSSTPTFTGIPTVASVAAQSALISQAKADLKGMAAGTLLEVTIGGVNTFKAGVYNATALTMAAGTTIKLDGQNLANQLWLFNIDTYLVAGASSTVELINAGAGSSIIWNSGSYTTLGASNNFMGTIFSEGAVTVGASSAITGPNTSCGGIFSATAAITVGALSTIGSEGCSGSTNAYWDTVSDPGTSGPTLRSDPTGGVTPQHESGGNQVPEPATLGLVFAGLAGMVLTSRRSQRASSPAC